MSSLVVTSINPHTKIEQQMLCFERWKMLGYKILSFNSAAEFKLLEKAGVCETDIVVLEEFETALSLFGKPIPRILPVLQKALEFPFDDYLLVNSDIYAAHRKPVSTLLSSLADCVAFTRNECVSLAYQKYTDSSPYRGGLDTFFFSRRGLKEIVNVLLRSPVSERMTFGVPGWDYFLGHTILMRGGAIMDGEVFLHQSHQTSYGAIDEFKFYSEPMLKSGMYRNADVNSLAMEFSQKIEFECARQSDYARLLKRMYYQAPRIVDSGLSDGRLMGVTSELTSVLDAHNLKFTIPSSFKGFLSQQLNGVNWSAAVSYRENELRNLPLVQSSFLVMLALLLVRNTLGSLSISTDYPSGSLHGVALNQILQNTQGPERLRYLLDLFASELIEHSIFNKELFNFFVLSSFSERAIDYCAAVLSIVRKSY